LLLGEVRETRLLLESLVHETRLLLESLGPETRLLLESLVHETRLLLESLGPETGLLLESPVHEAGLLLESLVREAGLLLEPLVHESRLLLEPLVHESGLLLEPLVHESGLLELLALVGRIERLVEESSLLHGEVVLGPNALGSSLVALSLGQHSPLLVSLGLLVEEIGPVYIVVLVAGRGDPSWLSAGTVALSLLSVLLGLG